LVDGIYALKRHQQDDHQQTVAELLCASWEFFPQNVHFGSPACHEMVACALLFTR
jgi:hypothetical protein